MTELSSLLLTPNPTSLRHNLFSSSLHLERLQSPGVSRAVFSAPCPPRWGRKAAAAYITLRPFRRTLRYTAGPREYFVFWSSVKCFAEKGRHVNNEWKKKGGGKVPDSRGSTAGYYAASPPLIFRVWFEKCVSVCDQWGLLGLQRCTRRRRGGGQSIKHVTRFRCSLINSRESTPLRFEDPKLSFTHAAASLSHTAHSLI